MNAKITGAGLALAMLTMAASPASAEEPVAPTSAVAPKPPFVAPDFAVPMSAEGPGFKLVPFSPALAKIDYAAYMSSIEHLQTTFSRTTEWPREGITDEDAIKDMEGEQARFVARRAFDYSVQTPDGSREIGSVYITPSPVPAYDAVVRMWVTKADYDAGVDAQLYQWVQDWVKAEWPFAKVAYPGRSIDWATWDAMVPPRKPGG
ncbi:MAG: twin-arginine translocation pathway signal protein [Candidatus Andeanibacterium colombiense]|uniref:Twin-arginine translocation pathway signal protein n=1 Tax=Candidatus Andeanibacterium colombiense TaxID=3121345 RepID=A0AAJ5X7R2_9SPHN|nr:MAG: twin-arginine translocation pathway signal protein [Sphingomonadaceae bacterium]